MAITVNNNIPNITSQQTLERNQQDREVIEADATATIDNTPPPSQVTTAAGESDGIENQNRPTEQPEARQTAQQNEDLEQTVGSQLDITV